MAGIRGRWIQRRRGRRADGAPSLQTIAGLRPWAVVRACGAALPEISPTAVWRSVGVRHQPRAHAQRISRAPRKIRREVLTVGRLFALVTGNPLALAALAFVFGAS